MWYPSVKPSEKPHKNNRFLRSLKSKEDFKDFFPNVNEKEHPKYSALAVTLLITQDKKLKEFLIRKRKVFKKIPTYAQLKRIKILTTKNYNTEKWTLFGFSEEEAKNKVAELKDLAGAMTKEKLIKKYGEEEGIKRFEEFRQKSAQTLENFTKRYGEEEGQLRHQMFLKKIKTGGSLEGFIGRYGEEEGLKKYSEYIANISYKNSLNYYKEKYGEEEGQIRYEEVVRKRTKKFKLEGWIEEFGEEEGTRKWHEHNQKKVTDLTKYLDSYGEKQFHLLFKKRFVKLEPIKNILFEYLDTKQTSAVLQKIWDTGIIIKKGQQSSISARNLLRPIHEFIKSLGLKNSYYGWDNKKEKIFEDLNTGKKYRFDYISEDLKLAIEYDGKYYHGTEDIKNNDLIKSRIIQEHGYTLFRFKEGEMQELSFLCDVKNWIEERIKDEDKKNNTDGYRTDVGY
jgi:hypothetical protein